MSTEKQIYYFTEIEFSKNGKTSRRSFIFTDFKQILVKTLAILAPLHNQFDEKSGDVLIKTGQIHSLIEKNFANDNVKFEVGNHTTFESFDDGQFVSTINLSMANGESVKIRMCSGEFINSK